MRAPAIAPISWLIVASACSASNETFAPLHDAGSIPDAGSTADDAATPEDAATFEAEASLSPPEAGPGPRDGGPEGLDGNLVRDSAGLDSAFRGDGSTPLMDGTVEADADSSVPPFVDPFDGASGCPDGGYPIGRGPCAAVFPLSGYPPLNGIFEPPACDNNNDGYSSLWFASNSGYSSGNTNVHVRFSMPLAGMIGAQPVTVSVDTPNGSFSTLTWSTAPGQCSVNLASDVCWDFEQVQYYVVTGTGHCTAPATSAGDAGGSLSIGDFWFQTVSYP